MKHKLLYILPALAVLFGFTACSSDDITDGGQRTELAGDNVIVKAGIGAGSVFTRSNPLGETAEQQASFNAGDMIAVTDGNIESYYKLAADGKTWEFHPSTNRAWRHIEQLKWDTNEKTFYAHYPVYDWTTSGILVVDEFENSKFKFNIPQDQNIADHHGYSTLQLSDVMTAKVDAKKTADHTLNISMERQTARMIINFSFDTGQFKDVNASIQSVTVTGTRSLNMDNDRLSSITPYNAKPNEYVALSFPHEAKSNETFLKLTIAHDKNASDKTRTTTTLTLTGVPALEKGKSYSFNVKVGKEQMSIESVTVSPWEDGGVIPGGAAVVRVLNLNLDTDLEGTTLSQWLEDNIGSNPRYTLNVSGSWKDEYFEPFKNFFANHIHADLNLNMSAVTGMTNINDHAFDGAKGLSSITLPSSVKTIGTFAFNGSGLRSISLNEGVETISSYAFYDTLIEELTLPASLVTTTQQSFALMHHLKTVRFKGDVLSIGGGIFDQDEALTDIYLDNCTTVPTLIDSPFHWQSLQYEQGKQGAINIWVKDADMKTKFAADDNWKALPYLHITYAGEPKTE